MYSIDKNKKLLVLVESPTKTKKVGEYLKKLGYNAIVKATLGHTTIIKDAQDSYKNTGIYPNQDFRINVAVAEDKAKVVKELKEVAKNVDLVIIASDPDREGENLGNHIKELLNVKDSAYYRVFYHSITLSDIKYAFEHPTKMNYNLVDAAEARQILDKLVGYALSPIARSYLGARSVGRCQSAGLKLIVDREKEIEEFKPETYVDLYLNFEKNNTKFKAKFIGTDKFPVDHLKAESEANIIIKDCMKGSFCINNIIAKEKKEAPKPPFCTSTFQQEANSKLGLSVKDAMSIAQKIYESGHCSYMRTDDQVFAQDFIDNSLKPYIEKAFGKASYVAPRSVKQQSNSQEGHEGLRVTDPTLIPDEYLRITGNQLYAKVYKLIWQRTIAACLPDAVFSETTYVINNKDYKFKLVSKELKDSGFKSVYNYKDNNDKEVVVKETFNLNEKLLNTNLDSQSKQTQPPARYKENTFLHKLEQEGIGRPATFATIISNVLSDTRGYCEINNKFMVPTDKGRQLIEFLDRNFSNIINIDYTNIMEKSLDLIAQGKLSKLNFLKDFYSTLEETIDKSIESTMIKNLTQNDQTCPNCGKQLVVRRSKYGSSFLACPGYPNCRYTQKLK